MTVPQPQTGSLRPTLIIGVGGFGRKALLELRCRFLDRFGDLDKLPLFRFLYIDTDADAVKAAARGRRSWRSRIARSTTCHCSRSPITVAGSWISWANGCRARSSSPCRER